MASVGRNNGAYFAQGENTGGFMDRDDREDTGIYKVVVNHEEQYSIWPVERANALGWRDAGKSGTKAECLSYIKEVWTDMRPLSLRRKMEEAAARSD
jgi:MbtH protein